MTVAVATEGDPEVLVPAVRSTVLAADPRLPVEGMRSMRSLVGDSVARERFALEVISAFGLLALLLSAVGLYGAMALLVRARRAEIGLRLALGAGRSRILALVTRDALRVAVPGIVAGLAGSVLLGRALESQLYGVEPVDGPTLAAIALLALATVIVAVAVPARRAAGVDPASSLRGE
jgi:ABC-type antimicrobial peptide transport system permease subunit